MLSGTGLSGLSILYKKAYHRSKDCWPYRVQVVPEIDRFVMHTWSPLEIKSSLYGLIYTIWIDKSSALMLLVNTQTLFHKLDHSVSDLSFSVPITSFSKRSLKRLFNYHLTLGEHSCRMKSSSAWNNCHNKQYVNDYHDQHELKSGWKS